MKNEIIRRARQSDAGELSQMICENAQVMLAPHYSKEQWDIFITYYSPEVIREKIDQQVFFCAEFNSKIVGSIGLDNDFVVGFYTRLGFLNKGIGAAMMKHLEAFASEKGLAEIQLAASPAALKFYFKNGWTKVKDITINHYGVGFEETLMVKKLPSRQSLFSYGTLQSEQVQLSTFGRKLDGRSDCLIGYELSFIKIQNEAVVASSGVAEHPIIKCTNNARDRIFGTVFTISQEELYQADAYEVNDYKRIEVQLMSGLRAWVFVNAETK